MKAILRSAVLVAGLSTLAFSTGANAAPTAVVFTGNAHVDCFGCGESDCNAGLEVTGTHNGHVDVTCKATELAAPLCAVSGTANGSGVGAGVNVTFNWTRVGVAAVITVNGSTTGAGVGVFVATGVACGAGLDAQVAGAIVGA